MPSRIFAFLAVICLVGTVAAQPSLTVLAPGTESFDNAPWATGTATSLCGSTGSVFGPGWTTDATDTNCPIVFSGNTPSPGGVTALTAAGAGNYIYTEASPGGSTPGTMGTVYVRYDASTIANPSIEFEYNMFNINFMFNMNMGTLNVDCFTDAGGGGNPGAWVNVFTISNNQGDQWNLGQAIGVPLNNSAGNADPALDQQVASEVLVRFQFLNGAGFESDIAINNVFFGEPTLPEYELNSSAGTMDFNGVQGNEFNPTVVQQSAVACSPATPATGVLNLSSDQPSSVYEVVLHPDPLVPDAAPLFGERINLNLFLNPLASSTLNGGPGLNITLNPWPGAAFPGSNGSGSITVPYSFITATNLSAQGIVVYAGAANGFDLTQASRLEVTSTGTPGSLCGPTGDEASRLVDLAAEYGTSVQFYDTSFTQMFVASNGRVKFNDGTTDFSPTPAEALTAPWVGCWMDIDPSLGGSIEISNPGGGNIVRVDYTGVSFFGLPLSSNTYAIEFDTSNGDVSLLGLGGIDQVNAPASDVIIGCSPGLTAYTGGAATDGGTSPFLPGTAGVMPPAGLPTNMIYDLGVAGTLPPSIAGPPSPISSIDLINGGAAGYTYDANP